MRALNRKLARDLYRSKGLLLAITSIISIGVMCYVTMQSAYHNLEDAKQSYYRRSRMADFWIDVKKVPLVELEALEQLPGVTEILPRIGFHATVDVEDSLEPLNGLVLSLPDDRRGVLNDIVIRQGGYFTDRRENEVIVNDAFARHHNLYPGARLHLLLNNRRQEMFVVGTAISSEFTYLVGPGAIMPDPEHFGVFYIKRTYAEDVFDFQGAANQIVGRLTPQFREHPDDVLRRAERLLESYGVAAATPLRQQASNQYLSSEIDGLGSFATVVPTIFLVVAALVLNVLITRLARQQRVVIGTFKALGYTDWQMFLYFLKFGLCVGVAGGLIGDVLGYAAASGMTVVYRQYFEFPRLDSGFHWYTHAVGLAVSLICATLGTLHGARAVLALQPAEAMRPEPPKQGGAIFLEHLAWLWKSLGASWRMALRSLVRHRFRTAVAVFASTMGAGLLVTGFMMNESIYFFLDFQFHRVSRSDIDLTFTDDEGRQALEEVRGLPGVDYAEPQLNVSCTFVHGPYRRKSAVTGLAPDARLTIPRDTRGDRIDVPESGLVMTSALADLLHVAPGDTLTMIPVQGERRPVDMPVVRIADSYIGLQTYADITYLSRSIGEAYTLNAAQLSIDPRRERELNRELKQTPGVSGVSARRDMIASLTETILESQSTFIGMLVLFAGVIFFGSIVNASIVNLAERQREVATFRALGYGEWRIGSMFLRESLLTNLAGTLLGMPVGYLLTVLTAVSYANELMRLPVVTAPWIWIVTLALSLLFALLAHGVVQLSIHRMNFMEALKVKE
ncbi:MAG: FtsX-like permease family protein [Pirellulaceae bacterium]